MIELQKQLYQYSRDLTVVHFRDAMQKGADVYLAAYRNILLGHKVVDPPGNTGVPATAEGSMFAKVGRFGDSTGVWLVVGPAVVNGKLRSPQLQFGEGGTAERHTRSGAYRGKMAAYRWLATVAATANKDAETAIMKRLIKLVS